MEARGPSRPPPKVSPPMVSPLVECSTITQSNSINASTLEGCAACCAPCSQACQATGMASGTHENFASSSFYYKCSSTGMGIEFVFWLEAGEARGHCGRRPEQPALAMGSRQQRCLCTPSRLGMALCQPPGRSPALGALRPIVLTPPRRLHLTERSAAACFPGGESSRSTASLRDTNAIVAGGQFWSG